MERQITKKKDCRFKNETCHFCNKVGHLQSICRSRGGQEKKVSMIKGQNNEKADDLLGCFHIGDSQFQKHVKINGHAISMIFDTGAQVSLIDENTLSLPKTVSVLRYG